MSLPISFSVFWGILWTCLAYPSAIQPATSARVLSLPWGFMKLHEPLLYPRDTPLIGTSSYMHCFMVGFNIIIWGGQNIQVITLPFRTLWQRCPSLRLKDIAKICKSLSDSPPTASFVLFPFILGLVITYGGKESEKEYMRKPIPLLPLWYSLFVFKIFLLMYIVNLQCRASLECIAEWSYIYVYVHLYMDIFLCV